MWFVGIVVIKYNTIEDAESNKFYIDHDQKTHPYTEEYAIKCFKKI